MEETIKNKILELLTTHTEHDGSYCDTGEDMEWACRSKCVQMAETRIKDYFKTLPN